MADESQVIFSASLDNVRYQLRRLDSKLVRDLDKANREAAEPLLRYGRNLVPTAPLSGWASSKWRRGGEGDNALQWRPDIVRYNLKARVGKRSQFTGLKHVLTLQNLSGMGAIFEVAGRGKLQGTTPQGKAFIRNLEAKYPRTSRVLWRAHDDIGLETLQKKVLENYNASIDDYNKRIAGQAGYFGQGRLDNV